MEISRYDGKIIYLHKDKNILAYMRKYKKLVRVLSTTNTGAIAQYELVDEPGNIFMPLIENGKNVDNFQILGEQLTLF